MSSTESRTGFRLPWSSDRSHEGSPADAQAESMGQDGPSASGAMAWPNGDINERVGVTPTQPRPVDELSAAPSSEAGQSPDTATQEPAMFDTAPVAQAPLAPRRPSKLMADLSAAILATAVAAREEALAKIDADVALVVADIRAGSKEGEAALKQASDEDIVTIREWSKAEIARIKEETEARIEARKALLGEEITAHAAAIERRVGGVEALAASYREDMAAYSDRLAREDDPARLATLAESMPEPPELAAAEPLAEAEAPDAGSVEPQVPEVVQEAGAVEAGAVVEAEAVAGAAWSDQPLLEAPGEPAGLEMDPVTEARLAALASMASVADVADVADGNDDGLLGGPAKPAAAPAGRPWGSSNPWASVDQFQPSPAAVADGPRWADGEAPEGFPDPVEGGDPVDRGAIMAALEAAAEAVVAAESAAESADQAEAAADVAETAAELVVGRSGSGDELDSDAQAAFSARVDAGGFDTESFTERLASLLPGSEPAGGDTSARTTQVIVSGLVSVASIASFKRHLGRIAGVDAVAVASGPEGEFVFNVSHRADVAFRDALPTLPGFAARVTSIGDGVITVTARDPEAES